jgi:hypothetical protein
MHREFATAIHVNSVLLQKGLVADGGDYTIDEWGDGSFGIHFNFRLKNGDRIQIDRICSKPEVAMKALTLAFEFEGSAGRDFATRIDVPRLAPRLT